MTPPDVIVIYVTGGIPGPVGPTCATVGGQAVRRGAAEAADSFVARVQAVAQASGVDAVVIGGLPVSSLRR